MVSSNEDIAVELGLGWHGFSRQMLRLSVRDDIGTKQLPLPHGSPEPPAELATNRLDL